MFRTIVRYEERTGDKEKLIEVTCESQRDAEAGTMFLHSLSEIRDLVIGIRDIREAPRVDA